MINVKVVPKDKTRKYPYIGKHYSKRRGELTGEVTYIKFIKPNQGVLIHTTRSTTVDPFNIDWNEEYYEVCDETIELSNDAKS